MADIIKTEAEPQDIICLVEARRWLAQASTVESVHGLRDRAEEVALLMKRRGYSLDAFNMAAELKLRAERRLGELLSETVKRGGDRKSESNSHDASLNDMGINWTQSSRWQQIASIPEETFERHVADVKGANKELTTAGALRLAKELRQPGKQDESPLEGSCSVSALADAAKLGVKFRTIYADPPWQYGNQATRAATDNHYPTMPTDEIAALPVADLAADSAHLHLWTTNGFLPDAFLVMESWGFEYKSCFVWCKPQMGIGNYWRVAHEYLLLGVRGACSFRDKGLISWAVEPRTEHSSKPERFRRLIEKASYGPRLELFGRHLADGWVVWGNQIERTMFDNALEGSLSFTEPEELAEPALFQPDQDLSEEAG